VPASEGRATVLFPGARFTPSPPCPPPIVLAARLGRVSAAGETIVFVHAHPDDEAIFTGGTMARLAAAGHRVVLVVATGGELGESPDGAGPLAALAARRSRETETAARLLGIERVVWLGYHDSGMAGDAANAAPGSFWSADVTVATARLAAVLADEGPAAVVVYDEDGIYGHPDHVQVHRVGRRAAARAGVPTVYDATVDREYLHFVETHLVEEAILGGDLGLVRSHIGVPSVAVDATVDVRSVLEEKRSAMAAHASQIPETTSALQLPSHHFADVYGWEWYVRTGPPGPIDAL
jgi:LmbE family N-acetylglucosaminyl deacetylase